jgi:hypothetical protein
MELRRAITPLLIVLLIAGCGGSDNAARYGVGVTVKGLTGTLVVQNSPTNSLTITSDGTYSFPQKYPNGVEYNVSIASQPDGQGCRISNATGTIAGAEVTAPSITCLAQGLALVAGNSGGAGAADGTGSAASFQGPAAVATDSAGNVYVADFNNFTIRRITPAGAVSTFAGSPGQSGSTDGDGNAARFRGPTGLATDSSGNIYVADMLGATIRKITPGAVVTTLAGSTGITGSADGTGATATFNLPTDVATDSAGNIYVADSGNSTIRKITSAGVVTTVAGIPGIRGSADSDTGSTAHFNVPTNLAVDSNGNIYVTDSLNLTIRKITPAGTVTTFAGNRGVPGATDGTGTAATFNNPSGITTDAAGNVYIADSGDHSIGFGQTIRKITPAGVVTTLAGTAGLSGGDDGSGTAARFDYPAGLAADTAGNLYVADSGNGSVRKISPAAAVTTLAGTSWFDVSGASDGTSAAARFARPEGVVTDSAGNVFIADTLNSTIRKITPDGMVTTLAGKAGVVGAMDGTGDAASFGEPAGLAIDGAGNIYVADSLSQSIRKITPAGVVTTLAGGTLGSTDGTGKAAGFNHPGGLAVDNSGNVYVADTGNSTIRKVTPAGVVTTFAGTTGMPAWSDAVGTSAMFAYPRGVAIDGSGNVYVADSGDDTIRKITPGGVVSTLAGAYFQKGSADGSGSAASFNDPESLVVDPFGNLYVADRGNNTIRKVTPGGVVTTFAGQAAVGYAHFAAGTLPGSLSSPRSIALFGPTLYTQSDNAIVKITGLR